MLTLDEDYMDAFKILIDAIWAEKGSIKQEQKELKEKRIREIDREIEKTVDKITDTQSDVLYKALEDRITKLDEEKKQLQAELLSSQDLDIGDYISEFD